MGIYAFLRSGLHNGESVIVGFRRRAWNLEFYSTRLLTEMLYCIQCISCNNRFSEWKKPLCGSLNDLGGEEVTSYPPLENVRSFHFNF